MVGPMKAVQGGPRPLENKNKKRGEKKRKKLIEKREKKRIASEYGIHRWPDGSEQCVVHDRFSRRLV